MFYLGFPFTPYPPPPPSSISQFGYHEAEKEVHLKSLFRRPICSFYLSVYQLSVSLSTLIFSSVYLSARLSGQTGEAITHKKCLSLYQITLTLTLNSPITQPYQHNTEPNPKPSNNPIPKPIQTLNTFWRDASSSNAL